MTKIGTISGTKIRYDVRTKCEVVKSIVTKEYKSKSELKETIKSIANTLDVNPVTIKLWIGNYANVYSEGCKLPTGVMSFSFDTITNENITKAKKQLYRIDAMVTKVKERYQTNHYKGLSNNKAKVSNILASLVSKE